MPDRQLRNTCANVHAVRQFTAGQAAQKTREPIQAGANVVHCRIGSSENGGNQQGVSGGEFTAAQAAQKSAPAPAFGVQFTAAGQAAQK